MFSVYRKDIYGLYTNPYGEKDMFRFTKNYKHPVDGGITIDNTYYNVTM